MAKDRKRKARGAKRGPLDERRRLIAAASLFGAVLVVLTLGAALRTEPPPEESSVPIADPRSSAPAPAEAAAVPEARGDTDTPAPLAQRPAAVPVAPPEPRPAAAGGSLAGRARSDRDRLRGSGGRFTVQLTMLCDPDNARTAIGEFGASAKLFLLPFTYNGQPCYRLCWGSYADQEAAENADDMPSSVESRFPGRQLRTIEDLTS
jgi:septal ring-binding cell division protein DamX